MLWKQTNPSLALNEQFLCTSYKLVRPTIRNKEEVVMYQACRLPSSERIPAWQAIKNELDSKTPSPSQIRTIMSGEHFDFDTDLKFVIAKKNADGQNDIRGYGGWEQNGFWEEIKAMNDLKLQVSYRTWSWELEPRSNKTNVKTFAESLRHRWSKFGYLWFDDITSEPIPLTPAAPSMPDRDKDARSPGINEYWFNVNQCQSLFLYRKDHDQIGSTNL